MIVRKYLDPKLVLMVTWKRVLSLAVVAGAAVFLYENFGNNILIPDGIASIFGTLLAILLGFRVNSAYERWWEARKAWGAVLNDTRSLGREILAYTSGYPKHHQKQIVYRQIAFPLSLARHLRGLPIHEFIAPYLDAQELKEMILFSNIPNAVLKTQAVAFQQLRRDGVINDFQHLQLEQRLTALTDSLGVCERIKRTVFPRDYAVYTSLFATAFSYVLPFIIVDDFHWQTIPWTVFLGFALFSIDRLARAIENPFENRFNDTPMNAISRTAEIDLRQMLGDEEIPEPMQPADGYLL